MWQSWCVVSEEYVALGVLLLVVVFLPAVCLFVARQAAEGLISWNGAAGIRTRYTQAFDRAWISGHQAALPALRAMRWVAGGSLPGSSLVKTWGQPRKR
jgi:hypothetical protein